MKKLIILLIIFIIVPIKAYCIDSTSCKYFPLNSGNKFYYKHTWDNTIEIFSVTTTQVFNGKTYFKCMTLPFGSYEYLRYDSTTGNILVYLSSDTVCNKERIYYNLSGGPMINCYYSYPYIFYGSYDSSIFGYSSTIRVIQFEDFSVNFHLKVITKFSKNFGKTLYSSYSSSIHGSSYVATQLIGAKINGILYGDTIVGIKKVDEIVPDKFFLSQNYPNPFNPTTIIRYQIKELSSPHALSGDLVTLKIYDILGKEIATLVNEKQSPGTYEVTWDGSAYPSGVYFYQLSIDNVQFETKKMILLK